MAARDVNIKLTVRGAYASVEGGDTVSAAITTVNKITTDAPWMDDSIMMDAKDATSVIEALATYGAETAMRIQGVTSATVTSAQLTFDITSYLDQVPSATVTAGDPLDVTEIFQDAYTDTTATPSMVMNFEDGGETGTVTIYHMADPEETTNFKKKCQTVGNRIGELNNLNWDTADMKLSAKERVAQTS